VNLHVKRAKQAINTSTINTIVDIEFQNKKLFPTQVTSARLSASDTLPPISEEFNNARPIGIDALVRSRWTLCRVVLIHHGGQFSCPRLNLNDFSFSPLQRNPEQSLSRREQAGPEREQI